MSLAPQQGTLLLPFRRTLRNPAKPLHVGVAIDRDPPPPWVHDLLAFLGQVPGLAVRVFTVAAQRPPARRLAWLADRLYSASRARFDPFGQAVLHGTDSLVPESVDAIRTSGCEVILWLSRFRGAGVKLEGLSTHGVFTVNLGQRDHVFPFWDEVANSSVTSAITVCWHDRSLDLGRVVRTAETSTVPGLFFTTNAEQPLIAAMRMLAALCLEIQQGARFGERTPDLPVQPPRGPSPVESPSNFDAGRFVAKKLMRSMQVRWQTRGKQARWFVAMRPNGGESITDPARLNLSGFTEVPLPRAVEAMADPFLWEASGAQYLLFEEVAAGQSRGRLGCVEVLEAGSCSEMKIILERPYHLSYPCVVPVGTDLFLLPETSEANRVELYRFTRFPWELELVASPVEQIALVDTTPVFVDGRWYIFTTTAEPFMETLLFSAVRLEGPWDLHACNPVSTTVRSCRSAGQLFQRNGRLFRPTQDCSVRYGYGIVINEVTRLTASEFEERPVSYVPPSWSPGLLGTHTWNESSRYQVLDGIRFTDRRGAP